MFDILPIEGGIAAVDCIFCDGISAGLKKDGALDVAFIYSSNLCEIEAIFTNNNFKAAPIRYFLDQNIQQSNFFLINTKNANAMTGARGISDIKEILSQLQARFPQIKHPIMASTGVIGQYLPKEKIISSFCKFNLNAKNNTNAAESIKTTDRFSKQIALKVELESGSFIIGAMAKGAGMINPSMATMLCFITTDAAIPRADMKELLNQACAESFNAISVDGDTSTNDSVFLIANQQSGVYDKTAFLTALKIITKKLALDIVSDGEGASKVVGFHIKGALNQNEAETCAKALANSLLVKTAIFGGDPNWGRIASTIGACGITASENTLVISIGEVLIYEREKIFFENEARAAEIMKKDSFKITCDLGIGEAEFIAYGCDLGHEYVKINSDYRS